MSVRARLYLDVDGVVCPTWPSNAWGETRNVPVADNKPNGPPTYFDMKWAPALIVALDTLRDEHDLELVWLSTWNEGDAVRQNLVPELGGLIGGRLLEYTANTSNMSNRGYMSGWWKAEQLLEDQRVNPGPFIWIDDSEVELHGWKVLAATKGTPSLMIRPHPMPGLLKEDIESIDRWLRTLA